MFFVFGCVSADSVMTFGACSYLGRACAVGASFNSTPSPVDLVYLSDGSPVAVATVNITTIVASDIGSALIAGARLQCCQFHAP